jgi:xanthine dehydrogenase YagS FAD-binding subunit
MQPFLFSQSPNGKVEARTKYLAGGTTLIDLMKLDVETPERVININNTDDALRRIEVSDSGLKFGALVKMSEAAERREVIENYPVIAQSLMLAASQQIRNMASLGGNMLQRTRCAYFRDVSYSECNKRNPGSGCAARGGVNRAHAVLGTSEACISAYPGDFAQALIALDAGIETDSRQFKFSELHLDAENPSKENILKRGELIRFITIPKGDFRRSLYLKIRDRVSYQFAITSAAVALNMDGDKVQDARIALGGVAYKPWRSNAAENELKGKSLDEAAAERAAQAAFADAKGFGHNNFKIETGKQTVVRALLEVKALEI